MALSEPYLSSTPGRPTSSSYDELSALEMPFSRLGSWALRPGLLQAPRHSPRPDFRAARARRAAGRSGRDPSAQRIGRDWQHIGDQGYAEPSWYRSSRPPSLVAAGDGVPEQPTGQRTNDHVVRDVSPSVPGDLVRELLSLIEPGQWTLDTGKRLEYLAHMDSGGSPHSLARSCLVLEMASRWCVPCRRRGKAVVACHQSVSVTSAEFLR
jgi:hypothetical protein